MLPAEIYPVDTLGPDLSIVNVHGPAMPVFPALSVAVTLHVYTCSSKFVTWTPVSTVDVEYCTEAPLSISR